MPSTCIKIRRMKLIRAIGEDYRGDRVRKRCSVRIRMKCDLAEAGNAHDIFADLDRDIMRDRIERETSGELYKTLESFANHIARICLHSHESAARIRVRVNCLSEFARDGTEDDFISEGSERVVINVKRRSYEFWH